MTVILTEDQSLAFLEGGWDQHALEELLELELALQEVQEPVAVVLDGEGSVAFFVFEGRVYHLAG